MKKVCVVTATRAEYGLLYWLMKEIEKSSKLQLQIIATGMHLSPEFGMTVKAIEQKFKIDKKIEMLLSSDTPVGIAKSMGLLQISIAEAIEELKPDFVIVLGDRYELIPIVSSTVLFNIPVVHLHGGEVTEGAVDELYRHAVTKMSHLHFVSTEEYKKRVIQMGEEPSIVFNVGAFGLENIYRLKLLNKEEFEKSIKFKLNKKNLLVTFHPVTTEAKEAKNHFKELLSALDELEETNIIFTKANSDTGGRVINKMIDEYVANNPQKSIAFTSMGQLKYLSALQFVDAVVGNSSSGIIEAPSFKIGTINIGERQKSRIKAKSVIDVEPKKEKILKAFKKLYSDEFQKLLKSVKNPYQKEKYPSKKVVQILEDSEIKFQKKIYEVGV